MEQGFNRKAHGTSRRFFAEYRAYGAQAVLKRLRYGSLRSFGLALIAIKAG